MLCVLGKVNKAKIMKLKGYLIPLTLLRNIRNFTKIVKIAISSNKVRGVRNTSDCHLNVIFYSRRTHIIHFHPTPKNFGIYRYLVKRLKAYM